ncbi:MAG: glutathione S-transferase C-terminal domain-containing protein [Minicystis sp.]
MTGRSASPRLLTIPISHYGERARWALDHAEIDYQEEHHLQIFSWGFALANGGRHTMPLLVLEDRVLDDSALIVSWAAAQARVPLYPADAAERQEIERFEADLSGAYAVDGRLLVYDWFFQTFEALMPYNAGRAPALEEHALRTLGGAAMAIGRRRLGVTPAAVERSMGTVNRTLDAIAARLRDGRRYLFGDSFTAADLAFAAFSAPSLVPLRYPVTLPQPEIIPEAAAARIRAWREHPAGRFALRLYEERPAPRGRYLRPLRVAPRR